MTPETAASGPGDVPGRVTEVLASLSRGEVSAKERLLPLVYEELRALAARQLGRERAGGSLVATDLAHRAYLNLVGQTRVDWKGRAHFLAVAAEAVRRILVDHARRRRAVRRGGAWRRVELRPSLAAVPGMDIDLLSLEEALGKLARLDARQAEVVRLRFYGGLTVEETAECLAVSPRTVAGDWRMARAWLLRELRKGEEE